MKKKDITKKGQFKGKKKPEGERFVRRIRVEGDMPKRQGTRTELELTVRGMNRGVIRMETDAGESWECRRERSLGALFGDRVLCEVVRPGEVEVRRVIRHAHEFVTGVLSVHGPYMTLLVLERHLPAEIDLLGERKGAKDGDVVRAKVIGWPDEGRRFAAQIEERIGSFKQARYALDALIVSSHLRTEFDGDVLAEADACRPAALEDDPEREDLRGILSFTIDGRTAKDFDDAVSLERLENGNWLLGVHIADVGHYVPDGCALDKEAFERGTSVYLPGRVLPMLPEQLSNGVCSLRPDEDKFTMSAMIELTEGGDVVCSRVARTITRSKARLVYDDVNALFAGDEAIRAQMAPVRDALHDMRRLSHAIRRRREAMGAIDFDTKEPEFVMDESGEPKEIVIRERGDAELMIEDFMLTANEAVAKFARENNIPLLYRIHEKPDPEKLTAFSDFLSGLGISVMHLSGRTEPGDIREILENTKDRPEYSVISTLALRSMQKARYATEPVGHFGLAMRDYCHFTSPIRRYPDLVVSRALTAVLKGRRVRLIGDALEQAAQRSSDCEKAAVEAERNADKIMMARIMASHVGERYEGTISGVTEWGLYVSLPNGAEGFVHVRTIDEWLVFDERRMTLYGERTGVSFTLGQRILVRVQSVELAQSAVNLELAQPLVSNRREKSERKRERERMREFLR